MQKPKFEPMIIIKPQDQVDQENQLHIDSDKLEDLQDILHQSYVNDQILMYEVINETQGLVSDVWEFKLDKSTTSDELSKYKYTVNGENGMIEFQNFLLDNNVNREHKISTSEYQKRRLKIIYQKQNYSQEDIGLSENVEFVYVYNKKPNNDYLIKVGDIIHDKTNPDTFWIVYKVEEQVKQKTINISKNDFIQIYKLYVSRLNLSILPRNIWNEYFPDTPYPNDKQRQNKSDILVDEDKLKVEDDKQKPKEEDKRYFYEEEDVDQLEGKEEGDGFKDFIYDEGGDK